MMLMSNFKSQKSNLIIALIIFVGFFLRIVNISSVPPGLTWDEAALGYNAYSLMQTGKDEYGNILPLNLKSFGDYKPALYAYLIIPFILLFGLTEIAVRMPSVLAGTVLIYLIYLLVSELTKQKILGIFSAIFVAVSPLSIQFSRAAFESNLAVMFNVLGTYLFIKSQEKQKYLIFSALFFGLSMFTYQASRIFVPLLILGLIIIYRRNISWNIYTKISSGILALFVILFLVTTFGLNQSGRLITTNYFAYQRSKEEINLISKEDNLQINSLPFQFLHGEWFAYVRGLFERYLIYFSPKMLFVDGDYSPRHRVPEMGVLYFISVLLIPFGIYYLVRMGGKGAKLVFFWLLVAPLPAVLSRDLISMVRGLNLVVPLTILEGVGLYWLFRVLGSFNKYFSWFLKLGLIFLIGFNFFFYLDLYFIHFPKEQSEGWLYGYKQVLSNLSLGKYNNVVITDKYGQPYIYYLFYNKYPPQKFQAQAKLEQASVDVGTVRKIDNIEFRHIYWPADRGTKNSLFIGTLDELPDQDVKPFLEYKILSDINFPDGQHAFRIVETK